jgi:hypothetical protein
MSTLISSTKNFSGRTTGGAVARTFVKNYQTVMGEIVTDLASSCQDLISEKLIAAMVHQHIGVPTLSALFTADHKSMMEKQSSSNVITSDEFNKLKISLSLASRVITDAVSSITIDDYSPVTKFAFYFKKGQESKWVKALNVELAKVTELADAQTGDKPMKLSVSDLEDPVQIATTLSYIYGMTIDPLLSSCVILPPQMVKKMGLSSGLEIRDDRLPAPPQLRAIGSKLYKDLATKLFRDSNMRKAIRSQKFEFTLTTWFTNVISKGPRELLSVAELESGFSRALHTTRTEFINQVSEIELQPQFLKTIQNVVYTPTTNPTSSSTEATVIKRSITLDFPEEATEPSMVVTGCKLPLSVAAILSRVDNPKLISSPWTIEEPKSLSFDLGMKKRREKALTIKVPDAVNWVEALDQFKQGIEPKRKLSGIMRLEHFVGPASRYAPTMFEVSSSASMIQSALTLSKVGMLTSFLTPSTWAEKETLNDSFWSTDEEMRSAIVLAGENWISKFSLFYTPDSIKPEFLVKEVSGIEFAMNEINNYSETNHFLTYLAAATSILNLPFDFRTKGVLVHDDYIDYLKGYADDIFEDCKLMFTQRGYEALRAVISGETPKVPPEIWNRDLQYFRELLGNLTAIQAAAVLSFFMEKPATLGD